MLFASCIAIVRAKTDYNKPTLNKNTLQRLLDTANIIGKPIRLQNFEVAQYDFDREEMTWEKAKAKCYRLGKGWRLPTKNELYDMYKNKDRIRGFAEDYYWSSTEDGYGSAWNQDFFSGSQASTSKFAKSYVRAIRDF